jgi:hypothetical protein
MRCTMRPVSSFQPLPILQRFSMVWQYLLLKIISVFPQNRLEL